MSKKTFNILSLEGGGVNGMMYCYLLAELEKKMGRPCYQIFDMISGTSIGGIVGALLSTGKSAKECIKFFIDDAPVIFNKKWYKLGLLSPKYDSKVIESILKEKFGNKTLQKDCKTKLLIPAFNLTSEDPFFFKSYSGKDYPIWVASRATSSAEVYFPAFKYENNIYWDGGNFSNSPEVNALADAVKLGNKIKNIKILSLGCGDYPTNDNPNKYTNCGVLTNIKKAFEVLFSTGSEDNDYICKQILGKNFLVISPEEKVKMGLDAASVEDIKRRHEMGERWTREYFWQIYEFLT